MSSSKKWFPLEANPSIMNDYLHDLGLSEPLPIHFVDVFGLDDDLLSMVPSPVIAVLLLYPITQENEQGLNSGVITAGENLSASVPFFTEQTVGNACGTIGILHAVLNNLHTPVGACGSSTVSNALQSGSILDRYQRTLLSKDMTPRERALVIETDDRLERAQAVSAARGDTANRDIDDDVDLHFVCLITHGGKCYELDGRKPHPVYVADCEESELLLVAARRVKQYIALNPDRVDFNVVALTSAPLEE